MVIALLFVVLATYLFFYLIPPFTIPFLKKRVSKTKKNRPLVSIVIPTKNEEAIIEKVIENWLSIDYPKFELIFVDASTDRTPEIIRKYERRNRRIKLLCPNLGNKLADMLYGASRAKGELVAFCDADLLVERGVLKHLVPYLDDEVGAVFALRVPKRRSGIFKELDGFKLLNLMLDLEFYSRLGSTPWVSISPALFRKDDLKRIRPKKVIADDLYLALTLQKMGKKCLLIPEARSFSPPLGTASDLFKRVTRTAHGSLEQLLRAIPLVFRKSGKFWRMVLPFRISFYTLPYVFELLSIPFLLLGLFKGGIVSLLLLFLLCTYLILLFVFSIRAFVIEKVLRVRKPISFLGLLLYPIYFFLREVILLYSFVTFLLGRRAQWKKTLTDREL